MYSIFVGYCGPTDCCLGIRLDSFSKEFAIESPEWKLLSRIYNQGKYNIKDCQEELKFIWNHYDKDSLFLDI